MSQMNQGMGPGVGPQGHGGRPGQMTAVMRAMQQSTGPNFASLFVILKPFKERRTASLKDEAIMAQLRKRWAAEVKEAKVIVFPSSPIPGLSVAGGFKVIVEDRGGIGLPTLQDRTTRLIDKMLVTLHLA